MYESEHSGRIKDSCDSADAFYKLTTDKRELEEKNKKLKIELGQALSGTQGSSSTHDVVSVPLSQNLLDLHKFMKEKAEKERDEMKEKKNKMQMLKEKVETEMDELKAEKKKLEYYIADLHKAAEVNKEKMKRVRALLDE
jgi:hypothetical protein